MQSCVCWTVLRISLKRKCEGDVEAVTTNTFCRKSNPLNIYKRPLPFCVCIPCWWYSRGPAYLVWFSDIHISVLNSFYDFYNFCCHMITSTCCWLKVLSCCVTQSNRPWLTLLVVWFVFEFLSFLPWIVLEWSGTARHVSWLLTSPWATLPCYAFSLPFKYQGNFFIQDHL